MEISRLPVVWLLLSSLVVIWDVSFVLSRPHSLPGGNLHHFFSPYALYIQIDKPYGDVEDEFVWAQTWLNVVEVILSFVVIFLTLLRNPHSLLMGLIVSVMTLWKTVLYIIQYTSLCAGSHRLKHLDTQTMILLFIIPNALWLVFPFILILYYSTKLSSVLCQKSQSNQKSQKKRN